MIIIIIIIDNRGLNTRLVSDAIVTIAAHRCLCRAAWLNSCRVAPHHCSMSSDHSRWGRPLLFDLSIIPNTRVRGDPFRTYGKALRFLKLESFKQLTGKIWLAPFSTDPPVWRTDGRTDEQTELRRLRRAIAVPAVARKTLSVAPHVRASVNDAPDAAWTDPVLYAKWCTHVSLNYLLYRASTMAHRCILSCAATQLYPNELHWYTRVMTIG